MGGIDPTVITHRLNVSPSFKPIKQKRRSFAPERQKAINEEVTNSSKQERSGKWSILSGWPTLYLSKKQMVSGDSVSTSLTSIERAQRIVSLYRGSTSS